MTKKKEVFIVSENLNNLFQSKDFVGKREELSIEKALTIITRQLSITGYRERTIKDYNLHVNHFSKITGIINLKDITIKSIYNWLESMDVGSQTRLTRLKCLKAFLSHCYNNGWFDTKFWSIVKIRVENKIKEGANEGDVNRLLSLLDLSNFVQLRDATAALLMFKTGIRINTLVHLENKHVDFNDRVLRLDGDVMKNHTELILPFDNILHRLMRVLIKQNELIRRECKQNNSYVFITSRGTPTFSNYTNTTIIQRRLKYYADTFEIKNINPHALRRGFAKNLLNKGANIAVISKALGHSDIAVTTQYLHLDKEEVAKSLRKFL